MFPYKGYSIFLYPGAQNRAWHNQILLFLEGMSEKEGKKDKLINIQCALRIVYVLFHLTMKTLIPVLQIRKFGPRKVNFLSVIQSFSPPFIPSSLLVCSLFPSSIPPLPLSSFLSLAPLLLSSFLSSFQQLYQSIVDKQYTTHLKCIIG